MSKYKYSVDLISGLRPKNNADFPLVRAHDVQSREDGTRLDAELEMLRAGSAAIYAGTVTVTDTDGFVLGDLGVIIPLTQGAAYKVTFNGTDYNCVGSKEDVYPYLGNAHFLIDSAEDTGEPFCLLFATHTTYLRTNEAGSYTLAIYEATGGGLSVTEVTSPDQITADSPDGFYIVPGGEGGGGSTGGTPIHYYDSLAAVPADLPEGSFVAVPSEGGVIDFTGVFDIAASVMAGGAVQEVEYAQAKEVYDKLVQAPTKVKVLFSNMTATVIATAKDMGTHCDIDDFIYVGGDTLYIHITVTTSGKIQYMCKQVTTTAYVP